MLLAARRIAAHGDLLLHGDLLRLGIDPNLIILKAVSILYIPFILSRRFYPSHYPSHRLLSSSRDISYPSVVIKVSVSALVL